MVTRRNVDFLRELVHYRVVDQVILAGEIFHIPNGSVWTIRNLTNYGKIVNQGELYIHGALSNYGVVINEGLLKFW